jgi:hypothetical protein
MQHGAVEFGNAILAYHMGKRSKVHCYVSTPGIAASRQGPVGQD